MCSRVANWQEGLFVCRGDGGVKRWEKRGEKMKRSNIKYKKRVNKRKGIIQKGLKVKRVKSKKRNGLKQKRKG